MGLLVLDYKKIYDALVEKCKVRGLDKSSVDYYTEIHHIIPRCLGGSDEESNLVMFSVREHLFAHICLWKAYPKHLGIVNAAQMMADTRKHGKLMNTKVLSRLREESCELRKLRLEGAGYGDTRHIDLSGEVFGRLTVLDSYSWHTFPNGQRKAKWECICECGNTTSVIVVGLTSGYTQSCGCLHKERTSIANKKWNVTRKTYAAYHNMLARCYNPAHKSNDNFRKYGIEVCDYWKGDDGLLNFVSDMGENPEGLQLIRLDPFADFSKENCKWVTKVEASKSIYKFPRKKLPISGVTGIKYEKRRDVYVVRTVVDGKEKTKQFKTLEAAIEFKKSSENTKRGLHD